MIAAGEDPAAGIHEGPDHRQLVVVEQRRLLRRLQVRLVVAHGVVAEHPDLVEARQRGGGKPKILDIGRCRRPVVSARISLPMGLGHIRVQHAEQMRQGEEVEISRVRGRRVRDSESVHRPKRVTGHPVDKHQDFRTTRHGAPDSLLSRTLDRNNPRR
jgi:hypothetical protein